MFIVYLQYEIRPEYELVHITLSYSRNSLFRSVLIMKVMISNILKACSWRLGGLDYSEESALPKKKSK